VGENIAFEARDIVQDGVADSTAVDDTDGCVRSKSQEFSAHTSRYVAADASTQSPTVEDEPIATIFNGSLDFRRAAVRGNSTPNERP
jgi:hypothetical protein